MAVYVDRLRRIVASDGHTRRVGARYGHLWCHMWADTEAELHSLAHAIGMDHRWYQTDSSLPHYDLIPPRRAAALAAGAVVASRRELVRAIRRERDRTAL